MKENDRMAALFELAKKANQHKSLAQHLSQAELGRERNAAELGRFLQRVDTNRQQSQEQLNYTYGL